MLKEKIYKDINAHRVVIEGTFKDSYPKPLDIVYGFEKKCNQLCKEYKALPNIIYITTRQVNKNDNFF